MVFSGYEFDDYTDSDDGNYSQVCEKHYHQLVQDGHGSIMSECAGTPICGIKGCKNTADFYIDFPSDTATE